jgi:hypothetical protein
MKYDNDQTIRPGTTTSNSVDAVKRSASAKPASSRNGYAVVFSVGWVVRGAKTTQDAINIAVSEVGKRLSPGSKKSSSVNITVQRIECNSCETRSDALLLVAETALVGLLLEVTLDAEDAENAELTARREIGDCLYNTPLTCVAVSPAD